MFDLDDSFFFRGNQRLRRPIEGEDEGHLSPSYADSGKKSSSDFDRTQVWMDSNDLVLT